MPDNATPIEAISLNFYTESESALKGIDSVIDKLTRLQSAIDAMSTAGVSKISRLADSLTKLSTVKVPNSVVNNVAALSKAVNGVGNISTEKVDRATEAVERLQTISATSVKDLGSSDVSLAQRYEGLSMFVDMSANSFARFNDQLMQTSMYSAITARSLDALYQSMGIGMGTQAVPMLPAPQTAGLLPDIAQSSTVLGQVERDLANIASGSAQFIATPISSYFRETAAAATDFANALKSLSQQENYVVRGALPEYSSATAMRFREATGAAVGYEHEVRKIAELHRSISARPAVNIPLAQTDNVTPIQAVGKGKWGSEVDFTARQSADSVNKLGKEVNNVVKESNKLGSASANIKALGKSANHSSSGLGRLMGSIKRIATYRLIRSALRAITNGFKEGVQNLYQWSKAFDKTHTFANSMDSIATSVLYLKNALGTLVEPIINAVAPALDWLVDKFVGLINVVNEWIAAFSGEATFTIARKVATSFDKTGKSAGKAAKAVKSFTIGIDELNIIEDKATSGGGGSGVSTKVGEDWFEKKPVGGDVQGAAALIAKDIKEKGLWGTIVGAIGEAGADIIEGTGFGAFLDKAQKFAFDYLPKSAFKANKTLDVLETMSHLDLTKGNLVASLEHFNISADDFLDTLDEMGHVDLASKFAGILGKYDWQSKNPFNDLASSIASGIAMGIDDGFDASEADKRLHDWTTSEKLALEAAAVGQVIGGSIKQGAEKGLIDFKTIPINKQKGVASAKSFLQGYQPTFVKGMDKLLGSPVNTKKYKHTGTTISREMALGILEGKGDINMAISEALQPKRRGGSGDYRELGKSVADSISAGIASGKSNLSSKLKKLVTDSTSGGKSAAKSKDVKDIGKYIVEGIIAGASDKKKDLEKAMKNLAKLAEAGFAAGAMIKSPSKLMAKDGAFLVQGLNMGIENEAHTTNAVMDNWLSSISDSVSIDVSNISMPNVADIVDEVQGYIATTGSMSIKSDTETMQRFYTDNIIPILSDIANDAKRQADKEEKTEVVLDNRKVTSAVNRQNRVNGYSFT